LANIHLLGFFSKEEANRASFLQNCFSLQIFVYGLIYDAVGWRIGFT